MAVMRTDAVTSPPSATDTMVSKRASRTLASLRAASGHCSSAVLACRNRL